MTRRGATTLAGSDRLRRRRRMYTSDWHSFLPSRAKEVERSRELSGACWQKGCCSYSEFVLTETEACVAEAYCRSS